MATTPQNIGSGEGGGRLPHLERLFNDIAADLADLFDAAGLNDDDRRHRASRGDEADA